MELVVLEHAAPPIHCRNLRCDVLHNGPSICAPSQRPSNGESSEEGFHHGRRCFNKKTCSFSTPAMATTQPAVSFGMMEFRVNGVERNLPRVTHHLASSPRKPRTQGHRKRIRQRRLWRATDGKADILLAFAPRTRENWHEHDGTDHVG